MSLPWLVTFLGGMGGSPVEDSFREALAADSLDILDRVLKSGGVDGIVLVTDDPEMASRCPAGVIVEPDEAPFHFGKQLAKTVERHKIEKVVYLGAGSATLMEVDDFFSLGRFLSMAWDTVITNNSYSADFTAFAPGEAMNRVEPPAKDDLLPRVLNEEADLFLQELPRSTATQFNMDTPADLAALKIIGRAGPRLGEWLDRAEFDCSRYFACLKLLTDRKAEILLAGRIGCQAWPYLEKEMACRVRLVSEERGMRAEGREHGARSLLGYHLSEVGCKRFFAELAEMADAAVLDTRIIFAHIGVGLSRADRFLSDLGHYEEIADPFLREFTEAAMKAPIPVLLGGHSLVAGGVMALSEHACKDLPESLQKGQTASSRI
jgi:hypothetical protein